MNKLQKIVGAIQGKLNMFDYTLLVFILMMSQDRILVKLGAIVFIFACRFNFKFDFKHNRLPLFYLLIIILEIIKYVFMRQSYLGNWATVFVSSMYWGFSFLALHQIKLSIERSGIEKSENTIKVFTVLNFLFCISQLIQVMLITGALNPYSVSLFAPDIRFPDVMFPYGQSSGDQIRGLFYDNHQNAIISQLCFVFFLYNRRYAFAALNFVIIMLICFNLVTLTCLLVLFFFFFILRDVRSKLFISALTIFLGLFYFFVTPENFSYLKDRVGRSITSAMSNKEGLVTENKKIEVRSEPRKEVADSDSIQQKAIQRDTVNFMTVIDTSYNIDLVSGKKIAYRQTYKFLKANSIYACCGCGAGMFSSKLANNFSGVFYGPTILNKNLPAPSYAIFDANHGSLYKYLKKLEIGKHSINNFPNSVYDQLFSEYGMLGLLLFVFFYIIYFAKRFRKLSYGIVLIPLLLIGFNYGYYFESLDITLFFEFLMFLNLRKSEATS